MMTEKRAKRKIPDWLKQPLRGSRTAGEVRGLLNGLRLHTVCESAACPNQGRCWMSGTATFMILGDVCTRNCRFCGVRSGVPDGVEPDEPERVAEAASRLGLRYVVITSVTRDDLPDGGAGHFARTVECVRERVPGAGVEVLTPDYEGESLQTVLDACPTVFNHNVETCRRLSLVVRPAASYDRSLRVLNAAARDGRAPVKSGFMLGLGETDDEVRELLRDLRGAGVEILTVGQYMRPRQECVPVERYVPPCEFDEWGRIARDDFGFAHVSSGPLVRSSFLAEEVAERFGLAST